MISDPIQMYAEKDRYIVEYCGKTACFPNAEMAVKYMEALRYSINKTKSKCDNCASACACHSCKANSWCALSNSTPCANTQRCPNLNRGYLRGELFI